MIVQAKKAFYAWLQMHFTECEIHINQVKEPASNTWLRVWVFQEISQVTAKQDKIYKIDMNFSFFSQDVDSIYLLDELKENLRLLIENRRICFDGGTIEFREFSGVIMGDSRSVSSHGFRQAVEDNRIIQHESIMVTAILDARRY